MRSNSSRGKFINYFGVSEFLFKGLMLAASKGAFFNRSIEGRFEYREVKLVAKLRELEARQKAIVGEMASLRPVPRLAPAVIENRLAEWRRLLRASTTQGRTVLQRILRGRLTFTPRADGQGYDFEGPTRFDKLFTGMAHGLTILGVAAKDWAL